MEFVKKVIRYIEWECGRCQAASHLVPNPDVEPAADTVTPSYDFTANQTTLDPDAFDLGSLLEPTVHDESEMHNPHPAPAPVVIPTEMPGPITYRVVEGASSLGKDVLVDSVGYQYTVKVDKRRTAVTWRCQHRSKNLTCRATVMERDGNFVRGSQHHVCNAEPGRIKVLEIRKEVKKGAEKRAFDSAAEIAEEVLLEIPPGQIALHPTLPRPINIARQGNLKEERLAALRTHKTWISFYS